MISWVDLIKNDKLWRVDLKNLAITKLLKFEVAKEIV
jgi:hypothetical protein